MRRSHHPEAFGPDCSIEKMELPVSGQLLTLAAAAGSGVGLGVVYDIFRVVRLHGGRIISFLADIIFCICMAAALFLLEMGPGGGEAGVYAMPAAMGGAAVYFAFLSRFMLGFLLPFGRAVPFAVEKMMKGKKILFFLWKKILKILKNIFSRIKKGFTINKLKPDEKTTERICASGTENDSEGKEAYEIRKGKCVYPDTYTGDHAVCTGEPFYNMREAGAGRRSIKNGSGNSAEP